MCKYIYICKYIYTGDVKKLNTYISCIIYQYMDIISQCISSVPPMISYDSTCASPRRSSSPISDALSPPARSPGLPAPGDDAMKPRGLYNHW